MQDIQGKVFGDFKAPTTSDGSYRGRKKIVDATKEHYNMKFEQELAEVNQRLKSSKTKVTLVNLGGSIQLRATLPLKPGDTEKSGRAKKQYFISLGIPANFDGLKTAQEEAYELGKLIARQTFTWSDKYLGVRATKDKGITFREFHHQLEKRYFETRKRDIRSEHTFYIFNNRFKKVFLSDDVISPESVTSKIKQTTTPANRRHAIVVARFICKSIGMSMDFSGLTMKLHPKKRDIPTDSQIIESFNLFDAYASNLTVNKAPAMETCKRNKIIYGLLAIYGLRPREIFNQPDLNWFISPENIHNTFKVHESNKTGYREVFPFVPEWIELFDLKKSANIILLQQHCYKPASAKTLTSKVGNLANFFSKYKIPFKPYDLRHACAIRAQLQGIPIKAAADNLGHTVEMHTKVYQQWFGLENRRKAFQQTFAEINEVDKLKDEIGELRKRIAELELENTKLRLLT